MARSLTLSSILVVTIALAACGSSDSGSEGEEEQQQPMRVERQVTERTAELAPVVDGNNAFAWSLYDVLRAEPGNRFFSPFSLYTALSMTYAGARGETATQMREALHIGDDDAQHHAGLGALLRDLSGEKEGRAYQLRIANRIFGQLGLAIEPAFLDLVATEYAAPMEQLDFGGDPEGSRSTINEWVAEQTEDRIEELLRPGDITTDTAVVLANAIYFWALWAEQFDPADTRDAPFTLADGSQVTVPMMSAEVEARAAVRYPGDGTPSVLELDYEDHEVSFVVLLPATADGLDALEQTLVAGGYDDLLASARPQEIQVGLPSFEFRDRFSAVTALRTLGAPAMFCDAPADFSGIASSLCVSDVVHEAYVKVDEEGTEAAAATAVVVTVQAASPAFIANHPFVFAIRDQLTGTILFLGRVEDPSAS